MDMGNGNKEDRHRNDNSNRDSSNTNVSPRNHVINDIFNDQNDQRTSHGDQEAFSWPPRSYTCSVCKREFRSAQALGGHMNVHRRERAWLRQSPPSDITHGRCENSSFLGLGLNYNLNPNPNPNFPASLASSEPPPSLLSSPFSGHNNAIASQRRPLVSKIKGSGSTITKSENRVGEDQVVEGFAGKDGSNYKTLKLETSVGLDSEICRDLDLELRLGYSN